MPALWQRLDGLWSSLLPLCLNLFIPGMIWPWPRARSHAVCVCIFIRPAGSYLGVKGSPLFLRKQRLWDETESVMAKSLCLAAGHCSMPILPHTPSGHHAAPGN